MEKYDINYNPENKKEIKITFEDFAVSSGIFAFNQCRLEKGIFKTKKEYTDTIGAAFNEIGIPISTGLNPGVIITAKEIKKFINDECTEFIDPDEKVNEIILKNFEQK